MAKRMVKSVPITRCFASFSSQLDRNHLAAQLLRDSFSTLFKFRSEMRHNKKNRGREKQAHWETSYQTAAS